MSALRVVVDSNLLLLLVVGLTDRNLVAKHKRLADYRAEDFDLLQNNLSMVQSVIVTPNTLSETSNLIDHIDNPARSRIYETLRKLLHAPNTKEVHIECRTGVGRLELPRLGFTDCTLLEVCASGAQLLTVDLGLYLAAMNQGSQALNFNHFRNM